MNTIKFSILVYLSLLVISDLHAQEPCWYNTPPQCKDSNFIYAAGIGTGKDAVIRKNKAEAEAVKTYMAQVHGIQLEDATYKDMVENGLEKIIINDRPVQYKIIRQGIDKERNDDFYTLLLLPKNFLREEIRKNIVYPVEELCDDNEPPLLTNKITVGICSFTGYNPIRSIVETNTINAFTYDGRFFVSKANFFERTRNGQSPQIDVDYFVSGDIWTKKDCFQYLYDIQTGKLPPQTMRINEQSVLKNTLVSFRISDAKTGQIYVEQTIKASRIYDFVSKLFPIKCSISNIYKNEAEMVINNGGRVSKGDMFSIYEVTIYNNLTRKDKIGKLKVTEIDGDFMKCLIKNGAKKVTTKFNSNANLLVEKEIK